MYKRQVIVFGDPPKLPVGPNQSPLNFQLALVSPKFGPDAFEIFTAVPVIKWTKGHASRYAARFINLPTRVHEEAFCPSAPSLLASSTGAITLRINTMANTEETPKDRPTHEEVLYHISATPPNDA